MQDGRSSSLTAPHGPSQQDVVRSALSDASAAAGELAGVQLHGTGTPLGDPIEIGALCRVVKACDACFNRPVVFADMMAQRLDMLASPAWLRDDVCCTNPAMRMPCHQQRALGSPNV